MIIMVLLCVLPFLVGAVIEYLTCRLIKGRVWRWVPPAVAFFAAAAVFSVRYFGWSADHGGETAPLETLIFIPILPGAFVFIGLFLGWRIWKRRWLPRVVRDK